jgi:hypothetical protein
VDAFSPGLSPACMNAGQIRKYFSLPGHARLKIQFTMKSTLRRTQRRALIVLRHASRLALGFKEK